MFLLLVTFGDLNCISRSQYCPTIETESLLSQRVLFCFNPNSMWSDWTRSGIYCFWLGCITNVNNCYCETHTHTHCFCVGHSLSKVLQILCYYLVSWPFMTFKGHRNIGKTELQLSYYSIKCSHFMVSIREEDCALIAFHDFGMYSRVVTDAYTVRQNYICSFSWVVWLCLMIRPSLSCKLLHQFWRPALKFRVTVTTEK